MQAAAKYCGSVHTFDTLNQEQRSEIVAAYLASNANEAAMHFVTNELDKKEVATAGRK